MMCVILSTYINCKKDEQVGYLLLAHLFLCNHSNYFKHIKYVNNVKTY